MLFLYLHTGFIHRLGSAVCWPTECNAVPLFLNLSLSVSISLPCTPSSPFSRSSPPPSLSVSVFLSLSLSFSNPLSVSVSFSFQAWNHLIIAYSSFGRLLNAHLSKPGGNNLPWDITHTCMRVHTHADFKERIYYSRSIRSSQKSITNPRLRKHFREGKNNTLARPKKMFGALRGSGDTFAYVQKVFYLFIYFLQMRVSGNSSRVGDCEVMIKCRKAFRAFNSLLSEQ